MLPPNPMPSGTFALSMFLLLAACSNAKTEADAPIFLRCEGESIDYVTGERSENDGEGITYRIFEDNPFQSALHSYDYENKMWVSSCLERGFQCTLAQSDDLFTEVGEMVGTDGTFLLGRTTQINRRTGAFSVTLNGGPTGSKVVFEGACEKTDAPIQEAAKF